MVVRKYLWCPARSMNVNSLEQLSHISSAVPFQNPPQKNEELINQFGSQQRIEELTRRGFAVVDDVSGRIESEDLMTDAASATRLKFVLVPEHVQSGQTASVIQLTFVLTDNQSDVID